MTGQKCFISVMTFGNMNFVIYQQQQQQHQQQQQQQQQQELSEADS
jgi:hypothetical protein